MGWERRKTKRPHVCNKPDRFSYSIRTAEIGDIWRCRKCKTRWELLDRGLPFTNWVGPRVETRWRKADPDPEYQLPPAVAEPPRQTGTDWLYSVEEGKA